MEYNAFDLVGWNLQSWKLTLTLVFKVGSIRIKHPCRVESKYIHDISRVLTFKLEYSKVPDLNTS